MSKNCPKSWKVHLMLYLVLGPLMGFTSEKPHFLYPTNNDLSGFQKKKRYLDKLEAK